MELAHTETLFSKTSIICDYSKDDRDKIKETVEEIQKTI